MAGLLLMDDMEIMLLQESLSEGLVPRAHYHDREWPRFLPRDSQDMFLTADAVLKCCPRIEADLADFVSRQARQVFGIVFSSGCHWREPAKFLELCRKYEFIDSKLPIPEPQACDTPGTGCHHEPHLAIFHEGTWGGKRYGPRYLNTWQKFYEEQWRFLAPVFDDREFVYELKAGSTLPITHYGRGRGEGHFSFVYEARLHPAHVQGFSQHIRDPCHVAIKTFIDRTDEGMSAAISYGKEMRAIKETERHDHIIGRIAAVTMGRRHVLISEWADRGSLENFWKENANMDLTTGVVGEVLVQFQGLADALDKALHSPRPTRANSLATPIQDGTSNPTNPIILLPDSADIPVVDESGSKQSWRHGDLKPENILVCSGTRGERLGVFKIADMGLAKSHSKGTQARQGGTSTTYGTRDYEPPEVVTDFGTANPRSKRYDIWSFGCILFENIVWLLYGYAGVVELRRIYIDSIRQTRFYDITDKQARQATVNPSITRLMDHILENDPECNSQSQPTAMRELLLLVKQKLLVVALPDKTFFLQSAVRTDAGSLSRDLKAMLEKARQVLSLEQNHYLFTGTERSHATTAFLTIVGELQAPRHSNLSPGGQLSVGGYQQTYQHPSLDPQEWQYEVDNDFASRATMNIVSTSNHAHLPNSSLCQQCIEWVIERPLIRTISSTYAERSSPRCDICTLFLRIARRMVSDGHLTQTALPDINVRKDKSGTRFVLDVLGEERRALTLAQEPGILLRERTKAVVDADGIEGKTAHGELEDVQVSLPYAIESGGPAHFELLRQWLQECDTNHACWRSSNNQTDLRLPTRLVDVRGTSTVRVVESRHFQDQELQDVRFTALSYPWGDSKKHSHGYLTVQANYEAYKVGISPSALPILLQEAIRVTRALAIPFIWIDGLCIMQDTLVDFEKEAERMEDVYSTAYCVLAASRSTGVSDAFLGIRNQPTIISIPDSNLFLREDIDDFQGDVIEGDLNKRGWVLQERALARRTIYFSETQTYWECGDGIRCESFTKMHNNQAAFLGDSNFPQRAGEARRGLRIRFWEILYEQYSRLLFTNYADRPIAIAGLERRLCRALDTDGGFGALEKFFARSILWQRAATEKEGMIKITRRPHHEPVPSWSWLGYRGAIEFPEVPFDGVAWANEEYRSPWSATSSQRSSETRLVRESSAAPFRVCIRKFKLAPERKDETSYGIVWDRVQPAGTLKCAVIGRLKAEAGLRVQKHYVLVLKETDVKGKYERVGMGVLAKSQIDYSGLGEWVSII